MRCERQDVCLRGRLTRAAAARIIFSMDREAVRRWKSGHDAVNEFERQERRRASAVTRFGQLAAAMRLARGLGIEPPDPFGPEVTEVRERWCRLRKALG